MNKHIISAIVSTSNYAVIRSAQDHIGDSLLPETKVVVDAALTRSQTELTQDIALSGVQYISIPSAVDPLMFIVPDEGMFEEYANAMERGFDNKIDYLKETFICSNVGFLRKSRNQTRYFNENFTILDMITSIIEESGKMENATSDDAIILKMAMNKFMLALCSDDIDRRLEILKDIEETMEIM